MPTRTISISEEAYRRLKALKREGESFSDVILRLTSKSPLWDLVNVVSDEVANEIEKTIRENREKIAKSLLERDND
ncbi:MAG: antitoxin VapB family protein [Candidatus Nezhaarchaeales archaeon]